MLTIHTDSVYNRPDWYYAQAKINGVQFLAWGSTRQGALVQILTQLQKAHITYLV